MSIGAKICGLSTPEAVAAAADNGASMAGFNFYPPSPRALAPERAAELARGLPPEVVKVAIFVDPGDADIEAVLKDFRPDRIQLHGAETPARVLEIKTRFGLPVIKAVKVAARGDLDSAEAFAEAADMLLFDAKAPADLKDALPGGNGLTFDWNLIRNRQWPLPWMLSGGLEVDNVAAAVSISGAEIVDVSSGVESASGRKDPELIKAFLDAIKSL